MSLIDFNKVLGNHALALRLRGRRAEVLASNIANAHTPGYKARDLDFSAALNEESQKIAMARTNRAHFSAAAGGNEIDGVRLFMRKPVQASLDGNTVDIQREQAAFAENAVRYQASLRFLKGKFSSMIFAIRGE